MKKFFIKNGYWLTMKKLTPLFINLIIFKT